MVADYAVLHWLRSSTDVLDYASLPSIPCQRARRLSASLIEPVIFSQRLRQGRWQAVCSLAESPGTLDSVVLYKTPSWGTMPLHVVEYPVSAYWTACCRLGPFSRGAQWGRAG
jgi:hypothetical protein